VPRPGPIVGCGRPIERKPLWAWEFRVFETRQARARRFRRTGWGGANRSSRRPGGGVNRSSQPAAATGLGDSCGARRNQRSGAHAGAARCGLSAAADRTSFSLLTALRKRRRGRHLSMPLADRALASRPSQSPGSSVPGPLEPGQAVEKIPKIRSHRGQTASASAASAAALRALRLRRIAPAPRARAPIPARATPVGSGTGTVIGVFTVDS